jgi:hypothetical protein
MRAVEALLVLALLTAWVVGCVLIVRSLRGRRPRWRVAVHSREDGATVVQLERPGEPPMTVRELPAAMDSIEYTADLRLAVEDAEARAEELNR